MTLNQASVRAAAVAFGLGLFAAGVATLGTPQRAQVTAVVHAEAPADAANGLPSGKRHYSVVLTGDPDDGGQIRLVGDPDDGGEVSLMGLRWT